MKEEVKCLLQEAKDKYPVGTVTKLWQSQGKKLINSNVFKFRYDNEFKGITNGTGDNEFLLYSMYSTEDKKWIEIISTPKDQPQPFKIEVGSEDWQTRDGREVRIYATDGAEKFPVHGAVCSDNVWFMKEWTISGKYAIARENALDLIPKPKKPLSFTEWFDSLKLDITRDHNGYGIWSDSILNEKVKQYLNDFNK